MPKNADINIRGLKQLQKKYAKIGADFDKAMFDLSYRAAAFAHSEIPPYPAASPGSSYTRTGTTGRTIKPDARRVGSREYHGILGTSISSAPWVISEEKARNGDGPQAWFHQGRWWTLQGVVRDAKKGIIKIYREGIKALIRKAR